MKQVCILQNFLPQWVGAHRFLPPTCKKDSRSKQTSASSSWIHHPNSHSFGILFKLLEVVHTIIGNSPLDFKTGIRTVWLWALFELSNDDRDQSAKAKSKFMTNIPLQGHGSIISLETINTLCYAAVDDMDAWLPPGGDVRSGRPRPRCRRLSSGAFLTTVMALKPPPCFLPPLMSFCVNPWQSWWSGVWPAEVSSNRNIRAF